MQLLLKTLAGHTITLDVETNMPIKTFKGLVVDELKSRLGVVLTHPIRLVQSGMSMQDDDMLVVDDKSSVSPYCLLAHCAEGKAERPARLELDSGIAFYIVE